MGVNALGGCPALSKVSCMAGCYSDATVVHAPSDNHAVWILE